MKKYLAFITFFLLSGCYPIYQKIRPALSVQVHDQLGHYIEGATVVRMTDQRPARVNTVFESKQTDAQGRVQFNSQRKWAIESIMIHGAQYYSWHICISKPGYETISSIKIRNDLDLKLILNKTTKPQEACYVENAE